MIEQTWDITVPYNSALNSVKQIANMKYLLTAVDVANHMLNGSATTDYGNGEFATLQVANTDTVNTAVETLIAGDKTTERNYKFFLTTTPGTSRFAFSISAAGEFYVDWGDGTRNKITRTNTQELEYSHNYSTAGTYTIKIGGKATAYNTNKYPAAIDFSSRAHNNKISSIDGSLGAIFSTLTDGSQPSFYHTFYDAYNMTASIPSDLFAGISGAPASSMFEYTFYGCSGLTGAIPDGLFAGISGKPASDMFYGTFSGCSGLTGAIPDGLFGNLSGAPASNMFANTFSGCSGLTSIPENLFGNISGTAKGSMFYRTFSNCTSLTGPSARINGQYLYEIWPDATSYYVGDMYSGATGLDDYRCIPTVWGGGGENCSALTAEFTLTTTPDTNSFEFSISAAGEFMVDWGDGTVETITKPDTTNTRYSHNYAPAGAYTIGLGGQATAYNTSTSTAAISFYVNYSDTQSKKIASIDGSLGAIFGTLPDATEKQPRFYNTFSGASNMTGSIPSDLFAGISGAPAESMFESTFYGCSGLTGAIPDGLFAGISGAPASFMFDSTFKGCSGLTGAIPDGLFGNLTGEPASSMFDSTFNGCSGLTGAIPDGLFGNLTGAPASGMFQSTFYGCSGLTGAIPDGLFGNLTGAPVSFMFDRTFYGCSGLTSIPENLFGNISGTAGYYMFNQTFYNCTSLTGPSARINGQYLYEIWPDATSTQVNDMYYNATKLSDYATMPTVWK